MAAATHQETITATTTVNTTLTTGTINGGTNQLYVCAIADRSNKNVTSVTDSSGMTWTQRAEQCAGRGQARVEVWTAFGSPGGTITVTVTLAASSNSIVVAVSRYDSADTTTPVEDPEGQNTVGANDTGCSAGTDTTSVLLTTTSTVADCIHYVAACPRNGTITTPDANYTQRGTDNANVGGEQIYLYVHEHTTAGSGAETCTHTLTTARDWCTAGLIIKPVSGAAAGQPINLRAWDVPGMRAVRPGRMGS